MPDANTDNYDLILPEEGGSIDTWGDKLNQNFAQIDSLLAQMVSSDSIVLTSSDDLFNLPIESRLYTINGSEPANWPADASSYGQVLYIARRGSASNAMMIVIDSGRRLFWNSSSSSTWGAWQQASSLADLNAELNAHKTSGDHDSRYYTKSQVDDRVELVGGWLRTPPARVLYFCTYKSANQTMAPGSSNTKITFYGSTLGPYGSPFYTPPGVYNPSTHTFTAPVDGMYEFWYNLVRSASVSGGNDAYGLEVRFALNGTALTTAPAGYADRIQGFNSNGEGSAVATARVVTQLSAGDEVTLRAGEQVRISGSSSLRASYWSGRLL